jgi:hypothetical protein
LDIEHLRDFFLSVMREIAPVHNLTAQEYFLRLSPEGQRKVVEIRAQKLAGTRIRPSTRLTDCSAVLSSTVRGHLLDWIADLVDENVFGRSEMCMQFAELLARSLVHLKLPARSVLGEARYYSNGREVFRWPHAWVRIGREVIDGNVDSLFENPVVPPTVTVSPYWGPIQGTPSDRHLREIRGRTAPADGDVDKIWWPELLERLVSLRDHP